MTTIDPAPIVGSKIPPALRHIDAYICDMCLTSVGSECHVPGCVFWMHDVPTEDTAHALRSSVEATS
jgi:hypothetical protein